MSKEALTEWGVAFVMERHELFSCPVIIGPRFQNSEAIVGQNPLILFVSSAPRSILQRLVRRTGWARTPRSDEGPLQEGVL
jgi:hypothetical protein